MESKEAIILNSKEIGGEAETKKYFTDKYKIYPEDYESMVANFAKDEFIEPKTEIEEEYLNNVIINKLLAVKSKRWGTQVKLHLQEIQFLIGKVIKLFEAEPMLLDLEAPIKIMGDTHGQYFDLFRLLDVTGHPSPS